MDVSYFLLLAGGYITLHMYCFEADHGTDIIFRKSEINVISSWFSNFFEEIVDVVVVCAEPVVSVRERTGEYIVTVVGYPG